MTITKLPSNLHLSPAAVVLVTGPSGSGKSRTLPPLLLSMGSSVEPCPTPHPKETTRILDQFTDEQQAIGLLSAVGLADALIWSRSPETLSVGQRARLEIALAVASEGSTVVIDEWLACLDRPTAKAVAWATQRALRKMGKGAIFITSQEDLRDDLQPDVHVRVGWDAEPAIEQAEGHGWPCSILRDMRFERGNTGDWHRLRHLHYAAGEPATVRSVWVARHDDIDGPAAVVVASYPDLHSAARNLATDNAYKRVQDRRVAQQLNREVCKLSRIVVAPQLRGIGLAHAMLSEIVPQLGCRYVESVTAMGRWSGFLRRVGFNEIPQTSHPAEAALMDWATATRPPAPAYVDGASLLAWIDTLSVRGRRAARRLVWMHFHHFVLHRRTRSKPRKVVPGPEDPGWIEAADLASRRLHERPTYWIIGPLDDLTGLPADPLEVALQGPVRAVS